MAVTCLSEVKRKIVVIINGPKKQLHSVLLMTVLKRRVSTSRDEKMNDAFKALSRSSFTFTSLLRLTKCHHSHETTKLVLRVLSKAD